MNSWSANENAAGKILTALSHFFSIASQMEIISERECSVI